MSGALFGTFNEAETMLTMTATEARKTFFELIKKTNQQHEIIEIQHKSQQCCDDVCC